MKAQTYYMYNTYKFLKIDLNHGLCECDVTDLSPISLGAGGMTFTPEGDLYYLWDNLPTGQTLVRIDTFTGNASVTVMVSTPGIPLMSGIIGVGNGIFYTMPVQTYPPQPWTSDTLYRWDTNNLTVTPVGQTGHPGYYEMCSADGQVYYISFDPYNPPFVAKVIRVDIANPSGSNPVVSYPLTTYLGPGVSASPICNTLIMPDGINQNLVTVSLIDGAITPVCSLFGYLPVSWGELSSHLELNPAANCELYLDLDCNDSSGATEADYNGPSFNCLSDGSGIADDDIKLIYNSRITEMKIEVVGFVPDAPKEILDINGSNPNIDVSGIGTDMMTLTDGGGAISTDFKNALRNIVYRNMALLPTPGLRTITVYFTTESGQSSNVATAFINVTSIPPLDVDLGPDQQACDGESVTFDAGHPGASYIWSTGEHTQTIDASESGQYIVNVSDGLHCPTEDTVELDIIPVINVSLTGDSTACDNESVNLLIQTDTPFSLNVEIDADPGTPFNISNVDGDYNFIDLPTESTTYTITSVIPSQDACIELIDSVHVVEIFSSYSQSVDVSICSGDSVWLGFFWETDAGIYENAFNTLHGCDSVVTTTITVLSAIQIAQQSTTCDSAAAGVFITFLNNPNGCDTMVTTTVTLLPSDTTLINLLSCNISSVGSSTQILVNQLGCDSVVITMTTYMPPTDTIQLAGTTCDSALLGVFPQFLVAQDGCDSIVITTVTMATSDTTYMSGISCDSASIGVFQNLLSNQMGCDSLVITTITAGMPDTTYQFATSCDSASLGVQEMHYTSLMDCDSVVITMTTYSAHDSTFIFGSSCNFADVGVFVQLLTNGFGCDSIVTTTVSLLPSSETFISSTTCDSSSAGNFDHLLVNQFGCDSIVHETVSLLPSSSTFLSSTTCSSSQAGTFVTTLQNQYGCDSIVTLTVSLIPADTTQLISKTCDPAQVGSTQNTFTNQDGCDSLVIQTTELFPLPQLNVQVTSDFNGYGISCFGESDGSAIANVTGVSPYQYLWSTGDKSATITGLNSGVYTVLVTDANGCEAEGSVSISEPDEFSIGFEVAQPDCFDNHEGSITVMQTGGVLPIRYSIDGINFQTSPVFNALPAGTYTVTAIDANECDVQEIIWINVPLDIHVDLGMDRIILPGDTTILEAIVNVPFDSLSTIIWSGLLNPNCPTCLTQPIAPIITTAYSISVSNSQGCSDQDSVIVFIQKNIDIYIPNVFSPNGDGINDRLLISAASEVEEIESMEIFDRWGNMVSAARNFPPNDPAFSWDGKRGGVTMNPAVFAYRMMARFKDGRREMRNGDVTLIR